METQLIRKQQKRAQGVRFVREVLTPMNPKDMFYHNVDQQLRTYFMIILVGLFMVMYMVFY